MSLCIGDNHQSLEMMSVPKHQWRQRRQLTGLYCPGVLIRARAQCFGSSWGRFWEAEVR